MTKENIIFALELCALGWAVFLCIRGKKIQQLYGIIVFIGMMLGWYPFYLPLEAGLTIWSALGVWIAFTEAQRQLQKAPLRILGMMLVMFTIVFLMKALIEMKIL